MKKQEAEKILKEYNQEHIIPFLENEKVVKQVLNINFEELENLYKKAKSNIKIKTEKIEPISAINPDKLSKEDIENYTKEGINIIKNNKFAAVTMAGGQGTRLGHIGPKGTFSINIGDKQKYLFQIVAENLKAENEKYGITIPWYIMTSKENNNDTVEFFKQHNYFNYPTENIKIFIQEEMPILTTEGKLLIDDEGLIKEASNGNGSIFISMDKSGVIEDMRKRGIEWIFMGAVDNILLKMVDPILIGLTKRNDTYVGSRTVLKNAPNEKVGVFCKENQKVKVIEYTELPENVAQELNENGELLFGESHIMCNLFNIKALEKATTKKMEYHIAIKKIEGIKCYKFEKFVFDVFSMFNHISILRGRRENDFAPIKNKEGIDSPETAIELYRNYWKI